MSSRQLILSYLLLGAYSLLLIHGLIPHQHEASSSDQSIHEHQHQHDHHHAHEEAGFLHFLFDFLGAHKETSDDSHHELVYTNPSVQHFVNISADLDLLNPMVSLTSSSVSAESNHPVYFRPLHRCNSDPPDPTTRSHRGPPALG